MDQRTCFTEIGDKATRSQKPCWYEIGFAAAHN